MKVVVKSSSVKLKKQKDFLKRNFSWFIIPLGVSSPPSKKSLVKIKKNPFAGLGEPSDIPIHNIGYPFF